MPGLVEVGDDRFENAPAVLWIQDGFCSGGEISSNAVLEVHGQL